MFTILYVCIKGFRCSRVFSFNLQQTTATIFLRTLSMDTKVESAAPYKDFEPFCEWLREKDKDTLVVQLPPGFKKEDLKVLVSNQGVVRFSGECNTGGGNTKSRFHREIRVAKNCDVSGIQAKLMRGNLHIIMPKNPTAAAAAVGESREQAKAQQEQGKSSSGDGRVEEEGSVPKLNRGVKVAVSGFLVAAMVVALGAFAVKYYQNFISFTKK